MNDVLDFCLNCKTHFPGVFTRVRVYDYVSPTNCDICKNRKGDAWEWVTQSVRTLLYVDRLLSKVILLNSDQAIDNLKN